MSKQKNEIRLKIIPAVLKRAVPGRVTMPSRRIYDPAMDYCPVADLGETFRRARAAIGDCRKVVKIETQPRMAGHSGQYRPQVNRLQEFAEGHAVPLPVALGAAFLIFALAGVAAWMA